MPMHEDHTTAVAKWQTTAQPSWLPIFGWRSTDEALPTMFRDAWTDTGTAVIVDMQKARALHKLVILATGASYQARIRLLIENAEDANNMPELRRLKELRKAANQLLESTVDARLSSIPTPEALAMFVPSELLAI